uniref:Uncharacterized protein n=2 Tax=Physcomitrium patens TaxID=3218 RepID=A0A2K1KN12_PHYPA|nr:hypothetical protein PHYPA_006059 [Physcomitrium patens]
MVSLLITQEVEEQCDADENKTFQQTATVIDTVLQPCQRRQFLLIYTEWNGLTCTSKCRHYIDPPTKHSVTLMIFTSE